MHISPLDVMQSGRTCFGQYQTSSAGCVTHFSTGGKFRPVSNFTELHTFIAAACIYALLFNEQATNPITLKNRRPRCDLLHRTHFSLFWALAVLGCREMGTASLVPRPSHRPGFDHYSTARLGNSVVLV